MDQFVNGSLRTWRLETQHDVNGDRHHQRSTGPESWRAIRQIGHGTFGEVWQERCLSGPSQNAFRAVKHIPKRQSTFAEVSRRELEALTTFSDSRIPEVGNEEIGLSTRQKEIAHTGVVQASFRPMPWLVRQCQVHLYCHGILRIW